MQAEQGVRADISNLLADVDVDSKLQKLVRHRALNSAFGHIGFKHLNLRQKKLLITHLQAISADKIANILSIDDSTGYHDEDIISVANHPSRTRGVLVDRALIMAELEDEDGDDRPLASATNSNSKSANSTTKTRQPYYDAARLIHLIASPEGDTLLQMHQAKKTRAELDARKTEENSWDLMAAIFNDYEGFRPQNACPHDERVNSLCPTPKNGVRPARTGQFLSAKYAEQKSWYTVAYQNHNRSGKQVGDPGEQRNDWWKFCDPNELVLYMFIVWKGQDMSAVSRLLGEDIGAEEGVKTIAQDGKAITESRAGAKSNKRKTQSIECLITPPEQRQKRFELEEAEAQSFKDMASAIREDINVRQQMFAAQQQQAEFDRLLLILKSDVPDELKSIATSRLGLMISGQPQNQQVPVMNIHIGTNLCNTLGAQK